MSGLRLYLLGPPRLERDGVPLKLRYRKNTALIVYLAVTGERHTREALVTLLWPEHDPSRARASLRRDLSVLRKVLGDEVLVADRETVGLDPGGDPVTASAWQALWLDVDRFRHLLSAWHGHGHPEAEVCPGCLTALAEAVELYRGDFLAGFSLRDSLSFDEWQLYQTEGLRRELGSALERLVRGHSAQGAYELALPYARRWVALDPLHEPVHRHLMQLYVQTGQRAAALRQYQECARILEAELSLSPSGETVSLYESIRARPADREVTLFPPSPPRPNLPAWLTPFVGREELLAEIRDRLRDPACRLLTLVGPGGSGKTRLAVEAASREADHYPHGIFYVPLAPVQSVESIVPAVAQTLGFSFLGQGDTRQQLLHYLRQKTILLLLDNFEHLVDGAGIVADILRTAPSIKALVTSRVALNVRGEQLLPVPGMSCPALTPAPSPLGREESDDSMRYSAVQLFLQGARRARSGYEPTAGEMADLVDVCRRVQGMPLALLLAAAWMRILSPAEIAAQVAEHSLDFLEAGWRDAPARQRSIRAVFDHSWRLLSERERQVFAGLSVFRGGLTHEAAAQVTGVTLRELMRLVDHSLLERTPVPSTALREASPWDRTGGRYEVHELLRQYGEEKLAASAGGGQEAHDRHAAYYAGALRRWAGAFKGPRQQEALAEMDVEIDNARAAWDWAVTREQVAWLQQGLEGLGRFYTWRGRLEEGQTAFGAAASELAAAGGLAAAPVARRRALAWCWAWQSRFLHPLGRAAAAREVLRQSTELLEELERSGCDVRLERAFVLWVAGYAAHWSVDRREAKRLYEQSLALYRSLGARWETASMLHLLGDVLQILGSYDRAGEMQQDALALWRELGDEAGILGSLSRLGYVRLQQGDFAEAERLQREGLALYRRLGVPPANNPGLRYLAMIHLAHGRYAAARSLAEEVLAAYGERGDRDYMARWTSEIGGAELGLGQYSAARITAQRGLAVFREFGDEPGIADCLELLGAVAIAEGDYAEAQQRYQECLDLVEGLADFNNTIFMLAALGRVALLTGDLDQALRHLVRALRMATGRRSFLCMRFAVGYVAWLLAEQGKVERAVEVYVLTCRCFNVANEHLWRHPVGQRIAELAASLPPDVVAEAQARGWARDLWATGEELLAELEAETQKTDGMAEG